MALTKKIDFGNGVVTEAAYIIVSYISLDFVNKIANFNIKTYLNKDVYDEGLGTIIPDENYNVGNRFNLPGTPIVPSQTTVTTTTTQIDLFSQYFLTGDARVNAETYLKTLDKFKDAVTVA